VPEVPPPADSGHPAPAGDSASRDAGDAGTGPAWVPLLALDHQLFPAKPTYTTRELAQAAGVDVEVARRLWRAMGFTPAPDEAAVYGEDDLAALQMAAQAMTDVAEMTEVVYQARMMAASLSRVAEVVSDNIVSNLHDRISAGMSEEEIVQGLSGPGREEIDRLIGYVYRRQLQAALWRKLADPGQIGRPVTVTVGFVDLVRFTAVTEDIAEEQLGELIDRFETIVYDRVTDSGGRVIKMIGDEVMFVTDAADEATAIAVDLVRTFHDDDSVPQARAGLAQGPVLSHGGDFFGPVVNLASRIVDVARPSTVVVSQEIHDLLADRLEFSWQPVPAKRLKGIGRTALFAVSGAVTS